MEIKLMKITLENFKGIKHLEIKADGNDINIYGENESGKTTVSDAYHWLLFNKDSQNKADFGIKTLKDGQEQHGLDHTVEAEFLIDDKPTTIKKTFKEVWEKKRGQTNKEFTGHKTDYEINSVPKKKKEFAEFIKTIIDDEKVFRLISDASYFNALKTDEKREILLNIAGDISDQDVIDNNEYLKPLAAHFEQYTADELRAKNKRDKKAINQKLSENPVRIDELKKTNAGFDIDVTEEELKEQSETHQKAIDEQNSIIDGVRSGDKIRSVQRQITAIEEDARQDLERKKRDAEKKLENYLESFDDDAQKQLEKLKYEVDFEQSNLDLLNSKRNNKKDEIDFKNNYLNDLRADHKRQIKTLKEIQEERKEFEVETVCSCCGQELPADTVEEHREKQQKRYNEDRAFKIEQYQGDIQRLIEKGKNEAATVDSLQKELEKIQNNHDDVAEQIRIKEVRIKELEGKAVDPKETDEFKELVNTVEEHEKALNSIENDLPENNPEFKKLIEEYQALKTDAKALEEEAKSIIETNKQALREIDQKKLQIQATKETESRINALLEEQQKLADEYEKLEYMENLLNTFVTSKVKLLEDKISDKFEKVRFNLFKQNINGGVDEICETTYKGVPYSKGLNTAGKVIAGLDIINTLSKHYDFHAPIVVDNAESITDIPETESQQIRLIVSKSNKNLKIEGVK